MFAGKRFAYSLAPAIYFLLGGEGWICYFFFAAISSVSFLFGQFMVNLIVLHKVASTFIIFLEGVDYSRGLM